MSDKESAYCVECGEKINAEIKHCPECGADQSVRSTKSAGENKENNSKYRYLLPGISGKNSTRRNVLVGIGYSALTLTGLSAANQSQRTQELRNEYPDAFYIHEGSGIVIESASYQSGQFTSSVTGTVVNGSENDYSYVQIEFDLLDSGGTKVGDALANTSGLDAGQEWNYEAVSSADEGSSIEVNDVVTR